MEQAELHSPQLVNVEVSIYPFFLNMKTEISIDSRAKTQTKKGKSYRKTIAAVFLASLFKIRDNQRPNPNDVAHNIDHPRQGEVTCLNRSSQELPRLHPITMLSTFGTGHDELSHRKWVELPEHNGSSFLQAPFEQPDIKSRVIEHSAHTPASQILLVALNKGV